MGAISRSTKTKHARYALVLLLAMPGAARAQARAQDRARVSVNVGVQMSPGTLTSLTRPIVFADPASINTTYELSSGLFFDGGVLIRVKRAFGIGVAVSSFRKTHDASISGTIPAPFSYLLPRTLSGTASGLERSETAVHVQAAYMKSSKRMDVVISAGPSFFGVSQDLVADATYADTYPYDAVTFSGATISKASETKFGFNAGADIGYKLSKNFGVGGLIRFSRASVTFPLANSASGVGADVGGFQAGGGVRFFF